MKIRAELLGKFIKVNMLKDDINSGIISIRCKIDEDDDKY